MTRRINIHTDSTHSMSRRAAIRSGGALAGMAAIVGAGSHTVRANQNQGVLELDIALDGRTWRMNRLSEIGPPLMGDTFVVFGSIYPGGSLNEGVSGPDAPGTVGRWICQGTFIVDVASEAVPHVLTTQQFIVGDGLSSSEGQIELAPDSLLSVGVEGGVEESHRTISGGYGTYAGATGSVLQTLQGTNETSIQVGPEPAIPAPNYRFAFSFTN